MRNTRTARTVVMAALTVAALVLASTAMAAVTIKTKVGEEEYKFQLYGFGQFEIRGGDGQGASFGGKASNDEGGVFFEAQRVRLGTRYIRGPVAWKLFLDFNQPYDNPGDPGAGLPRTIKDAFVSYKWSHAAFIRLGMIKTPLGLNFTIPGWNLDNVERNPIDKDLVFERNMGLMLSGRLIGPAEDKQRARINGTEMGHERRGYGFGYDIGVFNPATRSRAVVTSPAVGQGDSLNYVGRLHYDHGTFFHGEIAYGISERAGGTMTGVGSEDYEAFSAAAFFWFLEETLELKVEYLQGTNFRGEDGYDRDAISVSLGYMTTETFQLMLKHYIGNADRGSADADLSNTYIGFNYFLAPLSFSPRGLQSHKIVVNYVLTSGDDGLNGNWVAINGDRGYLDDNWIIQYQVKF